MAAKARQQQSPDMELERKLARLNEPRRLRRADQPEFEPVFGRCLDLLAGRHEERMYAVGEPRRTRRVDAERLHVACQACSGPSAYPPASTRTANKIGSGDRGTSYAANLAVTIMAVVIESAAIDISRTALGRKRLGSGASIGLSAKLAFPMPGINKAPEG